MPSVIDKWIFAPPVESDAGMILAGDNNSICYIEHTRSFFNYDIIDTENASSNPYIFWSIHLLFLKENSLE